MKKILGLDLGERRVGVAISDGLGMFAHPLMTLQWQGVQHLASEIKKIISEQNVDRIVIGIPFTMKGTASKKTSEITEIADQLSTLLSVEIIRVDERLTTQMAHQTLHAVGKKPSRNKEKVDQIAAVFILQTFLDKNKF
ncbi:MAG: Holliday junction resolvase RuvX [Calditrichaceae bacterium]